MKFHPILFSTEMVKALLAGRKKMTRRVVKNIDTGSKYLPEYTVAGYCFLEPKEFEKDDAEKMASVITCPYGEVGDVLWVRESFANLNVDFKDHAPYYVYKSESEEANSHGPVTWKPSIHIPKAACRIFLQIKSIRVEGLQDISEADAKDEGVEMKMRGIQNYVERPVEPLDAALYPYKILFSDLWSKINGTESWNANPWVWVIEFEQISKPKNFLQ